MQELFAIFNLPESDVLNINNADELLNYLLEKQKFICINQPQSEYEKVNLFDTIIQLFRKAGENLPQYFRDKYIICVVSKNQTNEIYTLSFQTSIPLVNFNEF